MKSLYEFLCGKSKSNKPKPDWRPFTYKNNIDFDKDLPIDFYSNLQKTIIWTEEIIKNIKDNSEINYSKVLRTTNPDYDGVPLYTFDSTQFDWPATPELYFDYTLVLDSALQLRQDGILSNKNISELGKIIRFEIDITILDGAPCAESNGFIDESDIPPIDTWFYVTENYLFCWIPKMFVEKMQNAIDVEILDSYGWLEEINPRLNQGIIERLSRL
jgi:hypothetical protein